MLSKPIRGKNIKVIDFNDLYPRGISEKMNKWLQGDGRNASVLDIVYHVTIGPDHSTGSVWAILIYAIPDPKIRSSEETN